MSSFQGISSSKKVVSINAKNVMFLRKNDIFLPGLSKPKFLWFIPSCSPNMQIQTKTPKHNLGFGQKLFFLGHDMHYNFFYQTENGLCRNSEVQVHHSFCLKTKFLH